MIDRASENAGAEQAVPAAADEDARAELRAAPRTFDHAEIARALSTWFAKHGISEVECTVPDINGVGRGKVLAADKLVKVVRNGALRIASSCMIVTLTGDYPDDEKIAPFEDPDVSLVPDPSSLRLVPFAKAPTAVVVADPYDREWRPVGMHPRHVLRRVLDLYAERGWRPIVAPELEFFLTGVNIDSDLPLRPPVGRSGRAETVSEPYGIDAVNEFETFVDQVYDYAEKAELDLDTLIHESGKAQLEINLNHGDAMALADQVILFKRLVRHVALENGMYATFMAKPMNEQPGSAMHLHQSVVEAATGETLFSDPDGADSDLFRRHVAGLQRWLPEITAMLAPNVNSFRRLRPTFDAPINVRWGLDNRSCGLRVPLSDAQGRRIENRLPGADANPHLALAASLVSGYLGMVGELEPDAQVDGSAYRMAQTLPRSLEEALDRFARAEPVRELLGDDFFEAFMAIKRCELDAFHDVVTSWEREHLLLKA